MLASSQTTLTTRNDGNCCMKASVSRRARSSRLDSTLFCSFQVITRNPPGLSRGISGSMRSKACCDSEQFMSQPRKSYSCCFSLSMQSGQHTHTQTCKSLPNNSNWLIEIIFCTFYLLFVVSHVGWYVYPQVAWIDADDLLHNGTQILSPASRRWTLNICKVQYIHIFLYWKYSFNAMPFKASVFSENG